MHCPHCGCEFTKKTKRSSPQHRRFFAIIKAAFDQWPISYEFQPDNPEHLRKWLICRAEFRTSQTIQLEWADGQPALTELAVLAMREALGVAGAYAFVRPNTEGGKVAIFQAKSIAHDQMGPHEFGVLSDAVGDIIEEIIGVPVDQLEREKAA